MPLAANAQTAQVNDSTLNRTVVVEQEYNPDILDASKVNVLPKVQPLATGKKEVEYDSHLVPATDIPAYAMPAYGGVERQRKGLPGYVRLGYGNDGNLDVYAACRIAPSEKDRLDVLFGMDGRDGKLELPGSGEKWQSHYYRTQAHLGYLHSFRRVDLDVAGNFGLSNFNLLPGFEVRKQKFTSGDLHFGVKSAGEELPLQFKAETNLMLYERQHGLYVDGTPEDAARETIIRTLGEAVGKVSERGSVGVAVRMDNFFYRNTHVSDYTSFNLNPYYLFRNEDWELRLGAHVDLAFGEGTDWNIAPDVQAQFTFADSYRLYARATGGKMENDFRRLEQIDPFANLEYSAAFTYELVNATAGLKGSPLPGFRFHLYGGFQRLLDDLYAKISYTSLYVFPYATAFDAADISHLYIGAEASYSYKGLLAFTASGVFHNWSHYHYEDQLYLKPALEIDGRVEVRPIPAVTFSVGERFVSREGESPLKADSVNDLYLDFSYRLFKGISIYARANNLLDKKYQIYRSYPVAGINFVGGVSFRF